MREVRGREREAYIPGRVHDKKRNVCTCRENNTSDWVGEKRAP